MVRSVKKCIYSHMFQLLLLLSHSLACPLISWVINAITLLTLLAMNAKYCSAKEKWKKWCKLMLFYFFALKFTSRPWIMVAIAAWPTLLGIFALAQFWPTLLPPYPYRKVAQCRNIRTQGEILIHFIFHHKKAFY
jgi:hypothetical protein